MWPERLIVVVCRLLPIQDGSLLLCNPGSLRAARCEILIIEQCFFCVHAPTVNVPPLSTRQKTNEKPCSFFQGEKSGRRGAAIHAGQGRCLAGDVHHRERYRHAQRELHRGHGTSRFWVGGLVLCLGSECVLCVSVSLVPASFVCLGVSVSVCVFR